MEIRGVWITNTDSRVMNSRQSIAEAMAFLATTGFNVVFPVVWNSGVTLYPSQVMRQMFGIEIDPTYQGRDPLAELISEAQRVGLAVIPWFEYGFASSYGRNGGRIIAQKPHWAARDRAGNLLSKNQFEWLNAFDPEVQNFLSSLILEVAKNYDIAGIQGDDRLPALPSEGGYDAQTIARFRQQFNQDPPPDHKEPQWLQWRADILTGFLQRLYRDLIAINPNLLISMAPSPYAWGLQEYLQDMQSWVDCGLVDLVHPQLYRRDFASYKQQIDRLVKEQFTAAPLLQLVPGMLLKIGSYRISPDHLQQAIAYNRAQGLPGEVFFFYEGLRENNNELATVLRTGPYAQPAPFPLKPIKEQGFTFSRLSRRYYYVNPTGQSVLQPEVDWADAFSEGLARVKLGYKYGYINTTGQLVIRYVFDAAEPFTEGYALVRLGDRYGYIDKAGKWLVQPQFTQARSFANNFAAVQQNNQWGYIDKAGTVRILPQFAEALSFSQGLAPVKLNNQWGYIDSSGKIVISPQFEQARSHREGLAAVRLKNQWGYIDLTGKLVIPPQFAQVEAFSEQLAAVKVGNLWGYINSKGEWVIEPEFAKADSFSEGLARINVGGRWQAGDLEDIYLGDGQWGYIRRP